MLMYMTMSVQTREITVKNTFTWGWCTLHQNI